MKKEAIFLTIFISICIIIIIYLIKRKRLVKNKTNKSLITDKILNSIYITSNKPLNNEEKEINLVLNVLLFPACGFDYILKSLFLFKDFRELVCNYCMYSKSGRNLIECFRYYEVNGVRNAFYKIDDFGFEHIYKSLNSYNLIYYLLEVLIIDSKIKRNNKNGEFDKLYQEMIYGSRSLSFLNEISLKQKIYNMFPILKNVDKMISSLKMKDILDREFFLYYVIFGNAKKSSIIKKSKILKKESKTYHIFYVAHKKENKPIILERADLPKLYKIWLGGAYELKSFHAIWHGNSGLERISCYRKNGYWYSFDLDYIVNENVISHLLCDGICDMHLFYEEVKSDFDTL